MAILRRLYLCFLVPVAAVSSSSSDVVMVDIFNFLGFGSYNDDDVAIFMSKVTEVSMSLVFLK